MATLITNNFSRLSRLLSTVTIYPIDRLDSNLVNVLPEHLREMFRKSCNCISLWQAARFADTCLHFANSFSKSQWDLGCCNVIEHVCDTGDSPPVAAPMRKTPLHFQEQERETLIEMLRAGVIAPSFFQIPVHKDSVEKFAFICKYGLFHHLRMPQLINTILLTLYY